jgi:hypothetical protein
VNEYEEVFYLQRLDAGLYTLQMTDLVLAFVTVNLKDQGVRIVGGCGNNALGERQIGRVFAYKGKRCG